jgi:hypothetical protein
MLSFLSMIRQKDGGQVRPTKWRTGNVKGTVIPAKPKFSNQIAFPDVFLSGSQLAPLILRGNLKRTNRC